MEPLSVKEWNCYPPALRRTMCEEVGSFKPSAATAVSYVSQYISSSQHAYVDFGFLREGEAVDIPSWMSGKRRSMFKYTLN